MAAAGYIKNASLAEGIKTNGIISTEIDGDLSARTTIIKYELVDGDIIKYKIILDLSSGMQTPSATADDIIGASAAGASSVAILPADFLLLSGGMRTNIAEGATLAVNLVLSSVDSLAEDATLASTGADELMLVNNLNGNSASGSYTSFENVESSGTRRYMYLTNNSTGNNTALGAAILEIILIGKINSGSFPIVPTYGGRRMAIGFSANEFGAENSATATAVGGAGNFMLTPNTNSSATNALVIPKNAFIVGVWLKSTKTITSGESPTYIIGLNSTTATEASGTGIIFTDVTLANCNTGSFVLTGTSDDGSGGTLANGLVLGAGQVLTTAAASGTVVGTRYTSARNFVTYGINTAENTAGILKILIKYIQI